MDVTISCLPNSAYIALMMMPGMGGAPPTIKKKITLYGWWWLLGPRLWVSSS